MFTQIDFSGGLDAEFHRLKSPENTYPLLINGRVRDGVISPVRAHLLDDSCPSGNKQSLDVVGDNLVSIINGEVYYRNLITNSPWQKMPDWVPLNATLNEIYTYLVPVTTNVNNRRGGQEDTTSQFNLAIRQTAQSMLVTTGEAHVQPRAIFEDLTWKSLNTYGQWQENDPEYVPPGILPTISGNRLTLVSTDRKKIYQSVTGRYFDFVVNITTDGGKGGNADTVSLAVDFNDLTAVLPISDGGLLASTLYASYLLPPTGTYVFGEPLLKPTEPLPVGAVNHKSFADVVGDTAFVTQSGIQSLNVVRQLRNESNNFPLSAKISRYLLNPQSDTAAVNFDDYALFAVNTTLGRAVVVFDTVRRAFVSIDTNFGTVKKFAVYKRAGVSRLFFINTDNELYEAYASASYATCRMLLGDYSADDSSVCHQVTAIHLVFTDGSADSTLRTAYYSDGELVDSAVHTILENKLLPNPPTIFPFLSAKDTTPIRWGPKESRISYKSSLWLEWTGDHKLVGCQLAGSIAPSVSPTPVTAVQSNDPTPIVFISELPTDDHVITESAGVRVGDLTVDSLYFVTGSANIGDRTVENGLFTAKHDSVYLDGSLYRADTIGAFVARFKAEGARMVLTGGGVTDGSELSYQRLAAITNGYRPKGSASRTELDVDGGLHWYERNERYGIISTEHIDFFFLSGGWNSTAEESAEIDGVSAASNQANWLRVRLQLSTKRFKVVIVGYPMYTDGPTVYTELRWPFRAWGADLVLCNGFGLYERFYINGLTYINSGCGGRAIADLPANPTSVASSNELSYLTLTANQFALDVTCKSAANTVLDATTIYPR